MKIKTSITLSNEILKAIDLYVGEYRSRSEFIETAARKFIAQLARKEAERRDLELISLPKSMLTDYVGNLLSEKLYLFEKALKNEILTKINILLEQTERYFTQLSIFKFGTRINSFSLLVTNTQLVESAWAAISISREPIGLPCFSKWALRLP